MTIRRQKNISDAAHALDRALDQREALLAKLVRVERKISLLRKRSARAQKAYVKGDASVAAGVAPAPYRGERKEVAADLDDQIGF